MSSAASRLPAVDEKSLVKAAIAKGDAFQRKYGRSPGIIVRRHHDHLQSFFSEKESHSTNWPMCLRCNTIVVEYGIAHQNDKEVVILAKCHGKEQTLVIRKPYRDVMRQEPKWISEVCCLLTFFSKGDQ